LERIKRIDAALSYSSPCLENVWDAIHIRQEQFEIPAGHTYIGIDTGFTAMPDIMEVDDGDAATCVYQATIVDINLG
jgi:hypothetical protein